MKFSIKKMCTYFDNSRYKKQFVFNLTRTESFILFLFKKFRILQKILDIVFSLCYNTKQDIEQRRKSNMKTAKFIQFALLLRYKG